jgi:hypothetical protein
MSIGAIGSNAITAQIQAKTTSAEATESTKVPDHDGDADDAASTVTALKAASTSAAPSVNANGQAVGNIISVKA